MEKPKRLVAVIYAQAGGFMARIMPPGIVCFSENMEGLQNEIRTALEDYAADIDDLAEAANDFVTSLTLAEWDAAEDASTVFLWDLEDKFRH